MFRLENVLCPKALSENVSNKREKANEGVPPVRFENQNRVHRRPRTAGVAGVDPRRGRGKVGYLRTHGALPRLWVVELVVDEHLVDDGLHSSGRWFGRWWISPRRAAGAKLRLGSEEWVH